MWWSCPHLTLQTIWAKLCADRTYVPFNTRVEGPTLAWQVTVGADGPALE